MAITNTCYNFGLLMEMSPDIISDKCIEATRQESFTVTKPDEDQENDLCKSLCADCGCTYFEKVFPGDITYIYTEKQIPSDSITFTVVKSDGQSQIISDQSLGEWVDSESFKADWNLIRNVFGGGIFQILVTKNILGTTNVLKSHNFQLTKFDECIADGCVKFEWNIFGSVQDGRNFDPEKLYSTRLPGRIVRETPEFEKETYQTGLREIKEIQTKVIKKYTFKSKLLPHPIIEMICNNLSIGDVFTVNDFNVGPKEFRNKRLILDGIPNLNDIQGTSHYTIELSFRDYKDDLIKRPC